MEASTAPFTAFTPDQANPTHPNSSFAANLRCFPSITHTRPAEEAEEKVKMSTKFAD
jgi:hypothetical protein